MNPDEQVHLGEPDGRFLDWYMRIENQCDADLAALKENYEILRNSIENRRRSLRWMHGRQFRDEVEAAVAMTNGKRKSVRTMFGLAGFRARASSIKIVDGPALLAWCIQNCRDALEPRIARTTPIKELIEQGQSVPGAAYSPARDEFYPSIEVDHVPNDSDDDAE